MIGHPHSNGDEGGFLRREDSIDGSVGDDPPARDNDETINRVSPHADVMFDNDESPVAVCHSIVHRGMDE